MTVEDANEWEPRFRYPQYEFFVAGLPNELIGRIEAADGDKSDHLTLSLAGANASMFFITPAGKLTPLMNLVLNLYEDDVDYFC